MSGQTYASHVHRPRLWLIASSASGVALLLSLWVLVRAPSLESALLVILAVVAVLGVTLTRMFALRLQDRIIRLEMHTRLTHLGRAADLSRLSLRQVIALRFASDAELPALIERAVAEKLTADQIKRAVTDWQGDYLRT
jgi:hypothetical protein